MNWIQQFRKRIEQESPQSKSTRQQEMVSEQERQPDQTLPPKVASTDRHETKRKLLPSPLQMSHVYQWLTSFKMEERIRGRCNPAGKCRFLIGWLPDGLRQEFEEKADLKWRNWNFLFNELRSERERERELLHLLSKIGLDILLLSDSE